MTWRYSFWEKKRKPNYFISLKVAQKVGQKANYSKNKALDKDYYLEFILKALMAHKHLTRKDFDELLWLKLPDHLSDQQKKNKISNLLRLLRKQNKIKNIGSLKYSNWVLVK